MTMKYTKRYALAFLATCMIACSSTTIEARGLGLQFFSPDPTTIRAWFIRTKKQTLKYYAGIQHHVTLFQEKLFACLHQLFITHTTTPELPTPQPGHSLGSLGYACCWITFRTKKGIPVYNKIEPNINAQKYIEI